jgi:hypothetical protein
MSRHVAERGQRTCFGSSPKNARCKAVLPQDRCDRCPPNQVVSCVPYRGVSIGDA